MNKLNILDGGFSLDGTYNEIYKVLDKMRSDKWYNIFKSKKFDYTCNASNNEKVLKLNCNHAKILKYILQLNLKQDKSRREYIYKHNNNVKYLNIVMIKEDIENFLITFVNMNEQLKLNYYYKNNQKYLLDAKRSDSYDINKQYFKLFATFGSIFSNVYQDKILYQEFYNIRENDYFLLYIINESLINIYIGIINAINISLGISQQQTQQSVQQQLESLSLSKYIIPQQYIIKANTQYTNIEDMRKGQRDHINKINEDIFRLKIVRMNQRRGRLINERSIRELLAEEYIPVTNVCVNSLNRCTDAHYNIQNLSLIKRLFNSLDTYI
jgi:hypothetical protein